MNRPNETNVLIGISGSCGVLNIHNYLMAIRWTFSSVKIVMTHSATQFIPKDTFSVYADGIYSSEFPPSKERPNHIELGKWADLFAVIPTTANLLAQVAHGFADSLLSATILGYPDPVLFFPNMNQAMWNKGAVQRNAQQVEADGHRLVVEERMGFEWGSREVETGFGLPDVEEVLEILQSTVEATKGKATETNDK